MRKTTSYDPTKQALVSLNDLCSLLGIGKSSALNIAQSAQAVIKIGRLKRFHVPRIMRYLEDNAHA